jgi:hypothetical protein
MTEFMRGMFIGLVLWTLLFLGTAARADELPQRPQGHTVSTAQGPKECFETEELRKIVLWVETAEHLHRVNHDMLSLLDTTRAELVVVGQEEAIRAQQLLATEAEVVRLRALVAQQADDYTAEDRQQRIRRALTWGAIGLLAGTAAAFAIAYGVSK